MGDRAGFVGRPGFWLFLYSVGTLAVFVVLLAVQTEEGRVVVRALGTGGARVLDGGFRAGSGLWAALVDALPPHYRPGSAHR